MSEFFLGSIDLNKIPKDKIRTKDNDGNPFKNGAKYLDIAVMTDNFPDQFGNCCAVSVKRKKGEETVYLGNLKKWESK